MAKDKSSKERLIERLFHRRIEWWGANWSLYKGTQAEFIEAEFATAKMFPGAPGGPVASKTFEREGRKHVLAIHSRIASPITYWIKVCDQTQAELRAIERARLEKERAERVAPEHEVVRARVLDAIKRGDYLPLARKEGTDYTEWTGARKELLSAGVFSDVHFPVRPKRLLCVGPGEGASRPGVRTWSTTHLARDYFRHVSHWYKITHERRSRDGIGVAEKERKETIVLARRCNRPRPNWCRNRREAILQ